MLIVSISMSAAIELVYRPCMSCMLNAIDALCSSRAGTAIIACSLFSGLESSLHNGTVDVIYLQIDQDVKYLVITVCE